jgi:hypothetical protein
LRAFARCGYVDTTIRPSPSIPQVTGDIWTPPVTRRVVRIARWRGRRNSISASRSTRSAVAVRGMRWTLRGTTDTDDLLSEDRFHPARSGILST